MQVTKLERQKLFTPQLSQHTNKSSFTMNTQGIFFCVVYITMLLLCNQPSVAQRKLFPPDHYGKRRFPYKQIFKVFCIKQDRYWLLHTPVISDCV